MIVGALAAGALAGAQDTASSSIKDAYAALKALLRDRLKGRQAAETALEQHEKKPDAWEPALKAELAEAGLDKDPAVLARAKAVLAAAPSASGGDSYTVRVRARNVQVGPGNTQYGA